MRGTWKVPCQPSGSERLGVWADFETELHLTGEESDREYMTETHQRKMRTEKQTLSHRKGKEKENERVRAV